jgi:hypothetical protein
MSRKEQGLSKKSGDAFLDMFGHVLSNEHDEFNDLDDNDVEMTEQPLVKSDAVGQVDSVDKEEKQPAAYLLERLLETAYIQLEHAKKMDAEKLKEATHRRQDLLFQLDLEAPHTKPTAYLKELQTEIAKVDERLMAVLELVNNACQIANPSKTPETYTSKGTISGYKI